MSTLQYETVARDEVGLYLALELSNRKWHLVFGDGRGKVRTVVVDAGDLVGVGEQIRRSRERFGLVGGCAVYSLYEAGRDGFWVHRGLEGLGVKNWVIDSSSIEVNRRARRAKTDRIDARALLELLIEARAGRRRVSVVRVPGVEQEDRRGLYRERERLQKERGSLTNMVLALLARHGEKPRRVGMRGWQAYLEGLEQRVGPNAYRQLIRAEARRQLLDEQIKAVQAQAEVELEDQADPAMRMISQLSKLSGIALNGARVMVMEVFAWRRFANRRELAASVGLVGVPYDSGQTERCQGISKAGNWRMRRELVELVWRWLRLQPDSELTGWYQSKFGGSGKRARRVGVVALARRLLIALWRYLEHGEVPPGARLKAA